MIAIVDVHYEGDLATAACVVADAWGARVPIAEHVVTRRGVAPYVPGHFYLRELPPTLAVLNEPESALECVVIDGHVWLAAGAPGFGARLHDALDGVPVVGVAKTAFRGAPALEVLRGASERPLHVSAVGMDATVAARLVREMDGAYRIPSLVRRADALSRGR